MRGGCIRPAPGRVIRLPHSEGVVRKVGLKPSEAENGQNITLAVDELCRTQTVKYTHAAEGDGCMNQFGAEEIEFLPRCQDCGCHAVFMALTRLGKARMRHTCFAASVAACGGICEMPSYRPMEEGIVYSDRRAGEGVTRGRREVRKAPFNTRYAQALSQHQRADSRHG